MATKTNAQYLRHILDTLGNLMGPNNYKESIEWLDAIENEIKEKEVIIKDMQKDIDILEGEVKEEEERAEGYKIELHEMEEAEELNQTIDTGLGPQGDLKWQCDNISIQSLMETLDEQLAMTSPLEIECRIKG